MMWQMERASSILHHEEGSGNSRGKKITPSKIYLKIYL